MSKYITKADFLNTVFCPTCGWIGYHMPSNKLAEDYFRIEEGLEVGILARKIYDGILIDESNFEKSLMATQKILQSSNSLTIFEASFCADEFATKADILIKLTDDQYNLIEVKSSLKEKPKYIDDMAYTAMVLQKCGIKLQKIQLLLLSKEYRLGMAINNLFADLKDYTSKVLERADFFNSHCDQVKKYLQADSKESRDLEFQCSKCEHLNCECQLFNAKNHVFDLPRLSESKFAALQEKQIESIEQIPDDFKLTPTQRKVCKSVQSSKCIIEKGLKEALDVVKWPVYYLDFETMQTAIPLYHNVAPFEQLPTQFSIHKCEQSGVISGHFEYLSAHHKDCREELIIALLDILETCGSIIVYSLFEKTVIKSLAENFPKYKNALIALIDRIVDLHDIIKNNFYHPNFCGSTSIKKVLPALVPDITYDNLNINNGDLAKVQFARMAKGKCSEDEICRIRNNLLDYCRQDTLAMVKLHEQLISYIYSKNLVRNNEADKKLME